MENVQHTEPATNIFDDQHQLVEASMGSRFLNFLIDNLFMNFALSFATGYLVGMILSYVAPDFLLSVSYEENRGVNYYILIFMISYFNYLFYYTICEKAFNGYTLGKIITGTKAIRTDGTALTFKDAILRSLSRIVPFEAFSALGGRPWHDSWTNTMVVKAR